MAMLTFKTAIVTKMLVVFLCVLLFSAFMDMNIATVDGGNIKRNGDSRSEEYDATKIDIAKFLESLPPHLQSHSHQAGGHHYSKGTDSIGMLEDTEAALLLKPVERKTINEKNFYEEIRQGFHPNMAKLLPEYHGILSLPYNDKGGCCYGSVRGAAAPKVVEFISLEDLTHGFKKPCVMDLKIGAKTWGIDATEEKIKHEKGKCKTLKDKYGFAMPGYLVNNPVTLKKTKFDSLTCRALTPETLVKAMEDFVTTTRNSYATSALVKSIIEKLEKIVEWASEQTELRLRATSILILYDSEELLDQERAIEKDPDTKFDFVRVKMVDFAHVYKTPQDDPGVDTNFLEGAKSVLKIFKDILKKHSNTL